MANLARLRRVTNTCAIAYGHGLLAGRQHHASLPFGGTPDSAIRRKEFLHLAIAAP
jgi:hypothetical protein